VSITQGIRPATNRETPSQRSMCTARARKLYDDQAKQRQKASGGDRKSGKSVVANLPQPIEGKSRDQAGKAFGVSGRRLRADIRARRRGPQRLGRRGRPGRRRQPRRRRGAIADPPPPRASMPAAAGVAIITLHGDSAGSIAVQVAGIHPRPLAWPSSPITASVDASRSCPSIDADAIADAADHCRSTPPPPAAVPAERVPHRPGRHRQRGRCKQLAEHSTATAGGARAPTPATLSARTDPGVAIGRRGPHRQRRRGRIRNPTVRSWWTGCCMTWVST